MPYSGLPDVTKAWAVVKDSGCDNAKLILDYMALGPCRPELDLSVLADVPADKVVAVQINDVQADLMLIPSCETSLCMTAAPGTGYGDTAAL